MKLIPKAIPHHILTMQTASFIPIKIWTASSPSMNMMHSNIPLRRLLGIRNILKFQGGAMV